MIKRVAMRRLEFAKGGQRLLQGQRQARKTAGQERKHDQSPGLRISLRKAGRGSPAPAAGGVVPAPAVDDRRIDIARRLVEAAERQQAQAAQQLGATGIGRRGQPVAGAGEFARPVRAEPFAAAGAGAPRADARDTACALGRVAVQPAAPYSSSPSSRSSMWISRIVMLSAAWLISGSHTRSASWSIKGRSR